MGFQQLYYTSCETGLAGYGGYQFNAVTPGTSPLIVREVEDRSVYEPPRWLMADPCPDEPEAYPVAFSYAKSEATDAVIITHVVFAGNDYSGRPGNYFAHALVTSLPEQDLGSLLPAELWGADVWQGAPIESSTLPELPGPLRRGVVDRAGVQRFLDARGTERLLAEMLTAVWRAMAGDRLVLLASDDPNENIWWIAAVSYLSGEHLAPAMTFTTYSHRPGYSRHHLIGIQADAVPPDADTGFQLFDLDAGKTPGGTPHPLAALLTETGVMAAEGLWRQAAAFASGTEEGPDDWLGPVAAAAGLLRGRLSAGETQAVVAWLPGAADRIPGQHAAVVLGVALAQPDTALADGQVLSLLGLARRIGTTTQVERLEQLLVERTVARLGRGEQAEPVRVSLGATETARAEVSRLLQTATSAVALAALEWAAGSGAVPADAVLEQYGRTGLRLSRTAPEAVRILQYYPAVLRGFLARLAREPSSAVRQVLASPVGALVNDDDLAGYPGLAEEWLLVAVDKRRLPPERAFDRIRDIRSAVRQPPHMDAEVLSRLWPDGCPPAQVADLLHIMADPAAADVRDWMVRQIQAAAADSTKSPGWLTLARALTGNRALLRQLPDKLAKVVERTVSADDKWRHANAMIEKGDLSVFRDLYAEHVLIADARDRASSADDLATLLYGASPLRPALSRCPPDVIATFCHRLGTWLDPKRGDTKLAARLFIALVQPDLRPEVRAPLLSAFEQVDSWSRRNIGLVGNHLSHYPDVAMQFQAWREDHSGWLVRKLRGIQPGAAEDH
jgi:hypothetical protein